jgi:hypothetical protein
MEIIKDSFIVDFNNGGVRWRSIPAS